MAETLKTDGPILLPTGRIRMAEPADGEAVVPNFSEAVTLRMASLIGLDLPAACLPGVGAGLEGLATHLAVLRSAEPDL